MTALSREGLLKKDITSFFCDLVRDMAPARQDLKVTYEQGFFLLETTDDKFDISWFSRVKMLELELFSVEATNTSIILKVACMDTELESLLETEE